jgi:hypothetical chaperone protein
MVPVIGIDFGTTNSVVSFLNPDGSSRTIRFGADALDVFRTVLCFWAEQVGVGSKLHHAAGPAAIQAYLDDPLDSRLIMSMKTYLAQRSFSETRIFGRRHTLENLVATFLRALLLASDQDPAKAVIVAGRPVRFAGENPDDDFGATRLRAAFAEAGLANIDMALEPEGAGYRFARTLTRPASVLIGDFGGGTSDFSILRFEPGGTHRVAALGNSGIGIAGDVFDYRIIDRVISPRLGKGDSYTVMGKKLPVPIEYFASFARWHRLSLMRNPRTLRSIEEVARTADHPERLRSLIRLIDDELGYQLYQTVSSAKAALSHADEVALVFRHKELEIDEMVRRADFESWIAPDLAQIEATIDRVLARSDLPASAIGHVFLTGGTSFVPAVRAIFTRRFGAEKVETGGEFVSVAEGLALIGRDRAAS